MNKEQLFREIEDLFGFYPDDEDVIDTIDDLIHFFERVIERAIAQEKVILELKDKVDEILSK